MGLVDVATPPGGVTGDALLGSLPCPTMSASLRPPRARTATPIESLACWDPCARHVAFSCHGPRRRRLGYRSLGVLVNESTSDLP